MKLVVPRKPRKRKSDKTFSYLCEARKRDLCTREWSCCMLIQNGKLLLDDDFVYRDLRIEGDRISEILPYGSEPKPGEETMDLYGTAITPGFIDLEVHGALGHDFSDGDREGYEIISRSLLKNGVTGFLAAVNAFPRDVLEETYDALGDWMDDPAEGTARMLGVHMRGPFIAKEATGCQDKSYVLDPDLELFHRLNDRSGGRVKMLTMSPELPGANAFIQEAAKACIVSLGNTNADFDTARMAYAYGARGLTDPFRNTGVFSPEEPGVIGAGMDVAEAILLNFTDEAVIHPATLRMLCRGNMRRICLVSGKTAFAGLRNGVYEIENHRVTKMLNRATFENGKDAGSVAGLNVVCRKVMSMGGIPLPLLFRSVTEIPARTLGIFDEVGSLEVGKRADLVMMDFHDYEVTHVFLGGKQVF